MIKLLFLNICIMISLLTLAFHGGKIKQLAALVTEGRRSLIIGVYGGISGVLLLMNSMQVVPGIILDFRNFSVMLAAVFGGPVSALTAAGIVAFYRIVILGASKASLVAGVAIFSVAVLTAAISALNKPFREKWILCVVANGLVGSGAFYVMRDQLQNLAMLEAYFVFGTVFMGVFLYYAVRFYTGFDEQMQRMESESVNDFLTGLFNVRGFDSAFNGLINRVTRKGEKLALLSLDIDHFKKVNDTYGHAAGDKVLKGIADTLRSACRDFDIISRNGGEEFSVILQDCPVGHAVEVAERIRRMVEGTRFSISKTETVAVTVSVGVAAYPEFTADPYALIAHADSALYHAKNSGRNRVVLWDTAKGLPGL